MMQELLLYCTRTLRLRVLFALVYEFAIAGHAIKQPAPLHGALGHAIRCRVPRAHPPDNSADYDLHYLARPEQVSYQGLLSREAHR